MTKSTGRKLLETSRQIAAVMVVCGVAAAVYATPGNNIVIVPPTNLPELAQRGGDALLLRATADGRKLLYVEQDNGSHLATFDVTDPGNVKGEGFVQLEATGSFDFVSPIGTRAELVRFRSDQAGAILDFRRDKVPNLETIDSFTVPGPISTLGVDGPSIAGRAADDHILPDHQFVGVTTAPGLAHALDVKEIREEVTNADTGTTFLLARGGLYEIRRPAVESEKKQRAKDWLELHGGAGG